MTFNLKLYDFTWHYQIMPCILIVNNTDYILRMAEAIGRAIAKIIGLKEQGQYDKALDEIKIAYSDYFDNFELLKESNVETLDLFGKLAMIEADIKLDTNDRQSAKKLYSKAEKCFSKAASVSKTFINEREILITQISSCLQNL